MAISKQSRARRGSALLAVLWLSAALAAIAFSLAATVKGETERASTSVDGLRSYYLATGAIERATVELLWSTKLPPEKRPIPKFSTGILYHFATGDVQVEFLPEAGKLDVNAVPVTTLYKLCMALGLPPERATLVAAAIDDWRGGTAKSEDQKPAAGPSFQILHASIQEIEELLQVTGITPDIFYGTYLPAAEGSDPNGPRLVYHAGLADCLSVFGSKERLDANSVQPAVLMALGMPPGTAAALVAHRRIQPFTEAALGAFLGGFDAGSAPLRVEGNSIITLRATARLRTSSGQLSDMRRTAAAQVKYMPEGYDAPIHILRWYDSTWIN